MGRPGTRPHPRSSSALLRGAYFRPSARPSARWPEIATTATIPARDAPERQRRFRRGGWCAESIRLPKGADAETGLLAGLFDGREASSSAGTTATSASARAESSRRGASRGSTGAPHRAGPPLLIRRSKAQGEEPTDPRRSRSGGRSSRRTRPEGPRSAQARSPARTRKSTVARRPGGSRHTRTWWRRHPRPRLALGSTASLGTWSCRKARPDRGTANKAAPRCPSSRHTRPVEGSNRRSSRSSFGRSRTASPRWARGRTHRPRASCRPGWRRRETARCLRRRRRRRTARG